MYNFFEKNLAKIQQQLLFFNLFCVGLTFLLFYIFSTDAMLTQLKKTALFFGNLAAIAGGIAFFYYILREAFVKLKRKNNISQSLGASIRKWIVILRLSHPLLGLMMFYFLFLHVSLLRLKGIDYATSVVLFGVISAGILSIMCFLGLNMKQHLLYRKYHRILALVLLGSYLGHLFIKIHL
jgi:hypothetical protein